jgi:UDP-glucose 4-epimerase
MSSKRILITGISSDTGGRLAQVLERSREIEVLVGIDTKDPRHEFQRTEFVRVDTDDVLLRRILNAAAIDTIIDTRLIADSLVAPRGEHAHEVNVVGTRKVLAACAGSTVRRLVFKSSAQYYGCDQDDPAFFTEDLERAHSPRTELERDVVEAEGALSEFASANQDIAVATLRCAEVIGADLRGSHLAFLGLPAIPAILGFDPRWQFVHHDDVIGALSHAARHELQGVYNVAADGVLALSEIASLLGKPLVPVLPPWGTVFAGAQLRRIGLPIPVELLRELRFGRGLDNRRLKSSGYDYRYTTREAVLKLRAQQRLRPLLRSGGESYRYEREVEEFLRWSPRVRSADTAAASASAGGNGPHPLDELSEGELIELISSLEPDALRRLRTYEESHAARVRVLDALDQNLARRGSTKRT